MLACSRPAARGAVTQTVFLDKIEGVTVQDIMDAEPVAVPAEISVHRALDEFFLRYRWAWFPGDRPRRPLRGTVRQQPAEDAERTGDGEATVRSVMDHDAADWRVNADAPLEALLASEPLRRFGALMAVTTEGVLRGGRDPGAGPPGARARGHAGTRLDRRRAAGGTSA